MHELLGRASTCSPTVGYVLHAGGERTLVPDCIKNTEEIRGFASKHLRSLHVHYVMLLLCCVRTCRVLCFVGRQVDRRQKTAIDRKPVISKGAHMAIQTNRHVPIQYLPSRQVSP